MTETKSLIDILLESSSVNGQTASDRPLKALAWARVSTDMQEDRGTSIEEQLREITKYAEKHGIEIVGSYHEVASAFQREAKRIEFHKMIERAKSDPAINIILVHDMSRFSRDSYNAKGLVRELRDADIKVVSLNDPEFDPESVAGVYMEAITYAKNEAYSREVAFHTRKGCRANAQTRDPETGWAYWNGGQPIWGYKIKHLDRGKDRSGKPIIKSIIVPDDRIINGKPVYEWAQYCLVELLAKGVSPGKVADFLNDNGIPAPRREYWGASTWNTLLQDYVLLVYSGYGVWNVHRKNGKKKPVEEWVIVENAHEPLISEDVARAIIEARKLKKEKYSFDKGFHRSMDSPYLFSGGLFKCGRCGTNLQGTKKKGYGYYVCGSQPHRKGRGCGPGVLVPVDFIEPRVIGELKGFLGTIAGEKDLVRRVNREIEKLWMEENDIYPDVDRKIAAIDKELRNIRDAVGRGLDDVDWANSRLAILKRERSLLEQSRLMTGEPPRIDSRLAQTQVEQLESVLEYGNNREKKEFLRNTVSKIQLAPDDLEVQATFFIPGQFVHSDLAGGGFEPPTSGL